MMETITIHALFGKTILKDIEIDRLHRGTYQPRDIFSEEALRVLSTTISQLGVLEPLIVRASMQHHGQFEIVAGERRYLAAKMAGLVTVPCLLSNYTNEQAAQIALIENTHREALNPIAEAQAMKRLATDFRYTHDDIGLLLGISRSHVSNMLRLLNLDARIQHWMKQGGLSEGHGKILAGLPLEKQYWYAYEAIKKSWSVYVLDQAIKAADQKKQKAGMTEKSINPISSLDKQVSDTFGHPVKLSIKKNESGYVQIAFHDKAHMAMILEKMGCHIITAEIDC